MTSGSCGVFQNRTSWPPSSPPRGACFFWGRGGGAEHCNVRGAVIWVPPPKRKNCPSQTPPPTPSSPRGRLANNSLGFFLYHHRFTPPPHSPCSTWWFACAVLLCPWGRTVRCARAMRKVGWFSPPVATGPRVLNSAPYTPLLVHQGLFAPPPPRVQRTLLVQTAFFWGT